MVRLRQQIRSKSVLLDVGPSRRSISSRISWSGKHIFPANLCQHLSSSLNGSGKSSKLLQNHAHTLKSSVYLHGLSNDGGTGSAKSGTRTEELLCDGFLTFIAPLVDHTPHWHESFISASRAMNEYLLDSEWVRIVTRLCINIMFVHVLRL